MVRLKFVNYMIFFKVKIYKIYLLLTADEGAAALTSLPGMSFNGML